MSKNKKKDQKVDDDTVENETEVESAILTDEDESKEEDSLAELDPVKVLEKSLLEAKDELAEQKDNYIRLQAETDNFKKRLSRDKQDSIQYANERLLKELISIVDNFERALEDSSEDTKSLKDGLEMILKQFNSFLEKEKVEPIKAVGEKFDPEIHEVLSSEESDDHEENTIVSQFTKGYTINNRVLRPSQVIISKKPSPESKEGSNHESEEDSDKEDNPTD